MGIQSLQYTKHLKFQTIDRRYWYEDRHPNLFIFAMPNKKRLHFEKIYFFYSYTRSNITFLIQ